MMFQPKIRQIHFCEFPEDRRKPEFGKRRPVVIFSKRNDQGVAQVIPITTKPSNETERWAVEIPSFAADGRRQWIVCNHLTTVSVDRLQAARQGQSVRKLNYRDFQNVVQKVLQNFPVPDAKNNPTEPLAKSLRRVNFPPISTILLG